MIELMLSKGGALSVERRGGSTVGAETEIDGWECLRLCEEELTEEVEPERE